MLCPVKDSVACEMEFIDTYTKFSRFDAAVLPAMALAPKELMEDWISTLEMEKMVLESPAGRPMRMISRTLAPCMRSAFMSRCTLPCERMRLRSTSTAEMYCATMVAIATPATPMPKKATVTMLSTMLTAPASDR